MITKLLALAAAGALLAGPVYADCTNPTPPDKIPDGNTASLDDMMSAKKAVKAYDDATTAYLNCLKDEHDAALARAGDKISDKDKANLERIESERHNAAVTALQSVADHFNEQVRAYKAKNDKKN